MSISVIIIHTAPEQKYRNILLETIKSIRSQKALSETEIIVADDGSCWSQVLLEEGRDLKVFDRDMARTASVLADLEVDSYLLARTSSRYLKAPLWNQAVSIALYDKLIFLDDDHPFTTTRALERYSDLLDHYEFVFGRIHNPDGTYRRFGDSSVQGTNFAIRRDLFERIGGFGEYTVDWGCGEDSDLFWKVYSELAMERPGKKCAFFAGDVVTEDLCTGRWVGCHGGVEKCIVGFQEMHAVHPLKNPSRNKSNWVEKSCTEFWWDLRARINNFQVNRTKRR